MLSKVLVVDDSEIIHSMYKMVFNKFPGCRIAKAMNGQEALDHLAGDPEQQLILLDINMPIMNGIRFLEIARSEESYDNIPIIVVSTAGRDEDTFRAINLGATGYLTKPFKANVLCELIERVVNQGAGRLAAPRC